MMRTDYFGDRMKDYESRNQYFLQRRIPVCIRVDMRAGHTFTKGFVRPFDEVFGNAMVKTMEYCAKNIGNFVFSYCQSDEITFILVDYEKLETDAWFNYRTDKLCSISASMATMAFYKYFQDEVNKWFNTAYEKSQIEWDWDTTEKVEEQFKNYLNALEKGAMFDARCFNIPKEEVTNLVYWRQLDAARNSIQMVGQAYFSHNKLQEKSCSEIQDMLINEHDINWNNFKTRYKRGVCWTKEHGIDYEMPMLKGFDRDYLDKLIFVGEK